MQIISIRKKDFIRSLFFDTFKQEMRDSMVELCTVHYSYVLLHHYCQCHMKLGRTRENGSSNKTNSGQNGNIHIDGRWVSDGRISMRVAATFLLYLSYRYRILLYPTVMIIFFLSFFISYQNDSSVFCMIIALDHHQFHQLSSVLFFLFLLSYL